MRKFPLSIPEGKSLTITQGFKSTELVDFYKSKGVNLNAHLALDVICGDAVSTYGIPLVCPFTYGTIGRINEGNAEEGLPGLIQVKATEPNGDVLTLEGIHLSGVVKQDVYKEGDILGYIGNYGLVLPEPTIGKPFQGAHIHLSLFKNGVAVDPGLYFDINNPYRSPDTGIARDVFAIKWAIRKIKQALGIQ